MYRAFCHKFKLNFTSSNELMWGQQVTVQAAWSGFFLFSTKSRLSMISTQLSVYLVLELLWLE
jgi:hypothetical protein